MNSLVNKIQGILQHRRQLKVIASRYSKPVDKRFYEELKIIPGSESFETTIEGHTVVFHEYKLILKERE